MNENESKLTDNCEDTILCPSRDHLSRSINHGNTDKIPDSIWSTVDPWLERLSNLAKIVLVLVAVVGYFYTVLPVYERNLLKEEISKKTVELRSTQKQIESMNSEIVPLRNKLDELNAQKVSLVRSTVELETNIVALENDKNRLAKFLAEKDHNLNKINNLLLETSLQLNDKLLQDFFYYLSVAYSRNLSQLLRYEHWREKEPVIDSPYRLIHEAVTSYGGINKMLLGENDKFKRFMLNYLEAHRKQLSHVSTHLKNIAVPADAFYNMMHTGGLLSKVDRELLYKDFKALQGEFEGTLKDIKQQYLSERKKHHFYDRGH